MRRLCSAAALLAAGCSRPDPLIICHNANCTGKLVVHRDDTLQALRDSLAVDVDGRPAWDGIEIDTVWHGAQQRCTFAHQVRDKAPDAGEAAALIADHLLTAETPSWNRSLFVLKIELKPVVGFDREQHDGSQERQHAECVLDLVDTVEAAATAAGVDLEVIADSSDDGRLPEV